MSLGLRSQRQAPAFPFTDEMPAFFLFIESSYGSGDNFYGELCQLFEGG